MNVLDPAEREVLPSHPSDVALGIGEMLSCANWLTDGAKYWQLEGGN